MAFVLISDITIGNFKKVKPIDIKVEKSIYQYVDKATIKLPITALVKRAGQVITTSADTAKQISEGDKVTIKLGYNDTLNTEFVGFVSRVNFTDPCELNCEGYSYQLRKQTYLKTFIKSDLKTILKFLIQGTDIVLDSNIPSFIIDKLVLSNHSGTEALEIIKKISDNTIRFYFIDGNVLYANLLFLTGRNIVKHQLGWNTMRDNNLKQRQAKNDNVIVNYIGEKKDGTQVNALLSSNNKQQTKVAAGVFGETKVIKTKSITDSATLQQMAQAKLTALSFDGYEGKITAFLLPFCQPGDKEVLTDLKYKAIGGNYIVESTEVTYNMSGARRIVGIGAKL